MKAEIDCDVRPGLTEIIGRSLGSEFDLEAEDGM